MSEADDDRFEDFEYDERDENAEWCDRCQGTGTANCYCGGDQCYCQNYGEMECPTCHGEGWFVPTPAQIEARKEAASWWGELQEALAKSEHPHE